ncbi:MAG: VIT domain-containing protein [Phycisphaeraceae bacterium]
MRKALSLCLSLMLLLNACIGVPSAIAQNTEQALARLDDIQLPPFPQTPPALVVRPDDETPSRALRMSHLKVNVIITGHTAQTSLTMTFRNDLNRVLEGQLYFPLPEGSTVSGYALDINGELVDAVVVDSHEARYIFDSEQRQGIDPGLVQWVKGNNFQTRVWPIPAKGERTVRVTYLSELPTITDKAADAKSAAVYQLPLKGYEKIDNLSVSVHVLGAAQVQLHRSDDWIKSQQAGRDWLVSGELKNGTPKQDLVFTLPSAAQSVHVGKGPKERDTYFVIRDQPVEPRVRWEPAAKGRLAVYWDASHSRSARPDDRDLETLKELIVAYGSGAVDVIAFRQSVDDVITFNIDASNPAASAAKIIRHLKQIPYDGGTNLSLLKITKNHIAQPGARPDVQIGGKVPDYAYSLLFTDGLDTLGDSLPAAVDAPLHIFASDLRANHPLLRHLAATSGGRYFNLNALKASDAVAAMAHPPFCFLRAEYDPKHLADVIPDAAQPVQGTFTFAGKLLVPETTVTLHYGFGDRHPVSTKITLQQAVAANDAGGSLVAHLWAQMKVDSLLAFAERNRDELSAIGKRFGIVTPGSSLLVLETLEQYLEYGIEPPASRKEIHTAWLKLIEDRRVVEKTTRQEKLTGVIEMWKAHVAWHEKEFKYNKDFKWLNGEQLAGLFARAQAIQRELPNANAEKQKELKDELKGILAQVQQQGQGGGAPAPGERVEAVPNFRGAPEFDLNSALPNDPQGGRPATPRAGNTARSSTTLFSDASDEDSAAEGTTGPAIALKEWNPDTPYLKAMKQAGPANAYAVYLDQRNAYAGSPAFFFDTAGYFFKEKQPDLAVRVLTSVLDMQLEDPRLMRIVAYQLQEHGYLDMAINLFEKVLKLRPEEPQSYRDLALALGDRADRLRTGGGNTSATQPGKAFDDYSRAIGLLNEVVVQPWDDRFHGIEIIALIEANRMSTMIGRLPLKLDWIPPIDGRLTKNLDTDVRIVMRWDTDLTDIDLWVIEPSGEQCYYEHPLTTIGGSITRDMTGGYGPEAYSVRKAMPGSYTIKANFYGSSQQTLTGGTTIHATIYTNFSRTNEKKQTLTLRLVAEKDDVDLGAITFGDKTAKPQK